MKTEPGGADDHRPPGQPSTPAVGCVRVARALARRAEQDRDREHAHAGIGAAAGGRGDPPERGVVAAALRALPANAWTNRHSAYAAEADRDRDQQPVAERLLLDGLACAPRWLVASFPAWIATWIASRPMIAYIAPRATNPIRVSTSNAGCASPDVPPPGLRVDAAHAVPPPLVSPAGTQIVIAPRLNLERYAFTLLRSPPSSS